jgi:tetraacyldisaccharide 4'-kinase
MLKSFRFLLFPLSVIYAAIIWLRNKLYDWNILKSVPFNFPLICVGNLAVGGTGKTPMVEYLVRLLRSEYKVATLSRGYKRKTKGFAIADERTTALEIGDEPMQFHIKFPEVAVTVCEERLVAIPQLLHEKPETDVIILDDAFQHRRVKAGLNILLTEYKNLYTRDFILPAGDLRDVQTSSHRAEIIVVTKCDPSITEKDKIKLTEELGPAKAQHIFFTSIKYGTPYHLYNNQELPLTDEMHVLLVCGIANPKPIKKFLNESVAEYEMLRFNDHHIFTIDDQKYISKDLDKMEGLNKVVLTTEKDAVRLFKFKDQWQAFPIYVLPMEHAFLFSEGEKFSSLIRQHINGYKG